MRFLGTVAPPQYLAHTRQLRDCCTPWKRDSSTFTSPPFTFALKKLPPSTLHVVAAPQGTFLVFFLPPPGLFVPFRKQLEWTYKSRSMALYIMDRFKQN